MYSLVGVLVSLVVPCQAFVLSAKPTVKTSWGDIEGINTQDEDGNSLEGYLGIPFARPPVGDLRFKKPVAHPGINTTFQASQLGPPCTQMGRDGSMIGDEDCLLLNVYAPSNESTSPKAVMVWIHGGSFISGNTEDYYPAAIVTLGDVIVVTVQYRLGPFGFLSTMDDNCKGNFGLWDQILALKWVKMNIASFGGNPGQITIFGESAGAASVGLLTISPVASDLFQRAILQSGSVDTSWAITRHPDSITAAFVKQVSCNQNSSKLIIDCLRKVPASTIITKSFPIGRIPPFGPVVDGEIIVDIPHDILAKPEVLRSSAFPNCDVMIGVNNNETGISGDANRFTSLQNSASKSDMVHLYKTQTLRSSLEGFFGSANRDMVDVAAFEYLYPDVEQVSLQAVINTKLDSIFLIPGIHFARTHASLGGKGRTFFYLFNHDPKGGALGANTRGMIHGYDVAYTFGFSKEIMKGFRVMKQMPPSEKKLSRTFRKILTQFAKSGDPSPAVQPDLTSWPEFDLQTEQYLNVDDTLTMSDHLVQRRVSLWLDLLPKLMD